ncbi:TadE/TadG family type IV pilus assembly protein [Lysinibacter cavernae]|uniref:Flp pilus assembly protein TadG n=1 Tax=Lysinibacter cavernae TaxID=1640652 RepID=A0A7X5R452_9MICO|nr:TadE/TadG family type IV pilus assembly protein [Lysinibacter cavernae]NIH55226.1 Flp pilus assembly protein TadG [Lysinibacter cavernae]
MASLAHNRVRLGALLTDARGSATVEFALLLPFSVTVLGLSLAAIVLATSQITLAAAASDVARMLARSEGSADIDGRLAAAGAGIQLSQHTDGAFRCVRLDQAVEHGPLGGLGIRLSAEGCALDSL